MNNIINALKNQIEGVEIVPACQGAFEIHLPDKDTMHIVFQVISDIMWEFGIYEDMQITTNQGKGVVYVDPIDRDEYDDDEEED